MLATIAPDVLPEISPARRAGLKLDDPVAAVRAGVRRLRARGATRVLLMTQGPRKVGILGLKARILEAQGKDRAPVLREQLALMKSLPATQVNPETLQKVEKELASLEAAPHAQR